MKATRAALVSVLGMLVAVSSTLAHHSNAVVDKDVLVAKTGEVTRYAFVSPHVAVYWQDDDGVEWYASGGNPLSLARVGWNNKTFQVGEKILVQGHPLRDGRPIMAFRGIYRCNGEEVPMDPGNVSEYRTRVLIETLTTARVEALCAGAEPEGGH